MAYTSEDFQVNYFIRHVDSGLLAQVSFAVQSGISAGTLASEAENALQETDSPLRYLMNTANVYKVAVRDLAGASFPIELAVDEDGRGDSGAMLPPQVALVWGLQADAPGRSGRGRMYWPFIWRNLLNADQASWNPGAESAAIPEAVAGWLAFWGGVTNVELAVNSRKNLETYPLVDIVPRLAYVGTQRRRAHAP